MDDRQLHDTIQRIHVLRLLAARLTMWATILTLGEFHLDTATITLTDDQKTSLRAAFDATLTSAEALADTLPDDTGRPGKPDPRAIAQVKVQPHTALQPIADIDNDLTVALQGLQATEQPDGTWRGTITDAQALDAIADHLATARAATLFYISLQRLRLQ